MEINDYQAKKLVDSKDILERLLEELIILSRYKTQIDPREIVKPLQKALTFLDTTVSDIESIEVELGEVE